jgi:hypothetical protein
MAATAAEARYRIDFPEPAARDSRVIALDAPAAEVVRRLAEHSWRGGRFLVFEDVLSTDGEATDGEATDGGDATLRTADGTETLLSMELAAADVAVVVATPAVRPEAAAVFGDACAARMIMSAGLILAESEPPEEAVSALRPNAMVLAILKDEADIPPILTALRV